MGGLSLGLGPVSSRRTVCKFRYAVRMILNICLGVGLSAKSIEEGGGDLIIVYNSGRFRMAGRGSLAGMMPYGDANAVVLEMVGKRHVQ